MKLVSKEDKKLGQLLTNAISLDSLTRLSRPGFFRNFLTIAEIEFAGNSPFNASRKLIRPEVGPRDSDSFRSTSDRLILTKLPSDDDPRL